MDTFQVTQQFRMNPRIVTNPKEIVRFDKSYSSISSGIRRETILIESYTGITKTGHLLILPLFSGSSPLEKQAVFLSNLTYSNINEAEKLIREGLMCSWELGYHVAFASDSNSLYKNSGFRNISKNFFSSFPHRAPLLYSELSWNGIKKIAHDLIFPVTENARQ